MLEVMLGAAFSAVPLILLIPPMRRFSVFMVKFEDLVQDFTSQTSEIYGRLQFFTSLIFAATFRHSRRYHY